MRVEKEEEMLCWYMRRGGEEEEDAGWRGRGTFALFAIECYHNTVE